MSHEWEKVPSSSPPYGETKVHVVEIEGGQGISMLQAELDQVVAMLEAGRRLLVGPLSVVVGKLGPGGFSYYVVATTRPGPVHPLA